MARIQNTPRPAANAVQAPVAAAAQKVAPATVQKAPAPRQDRFDGVMGTTGAGPARDVPTATVRFGPQWEEGVQGTLKAGGKLNLEYDPVRATQRHTHNGFPAWGVTAYVKFSPGGKVVEKPAVEFESIMGRPTNNAKPAQVSVDIPADATRVEVWFRNWTGADSPRESWDSDYGRNYAFDVTP